MRTAWRLAFGVLFAVAMTTAQGDQTQDDLERIGMRRGIVAYLDLPPGGAEQIVKIAKASELTIYFQSLDAKQVASIQEAADSENLLGTRLFAHQGEPETIHLANNVADFVWVSDEGNTSDEEVTRALRPKGRAFIGGRSFVKPVPAGMDDWSHPYHGPDNNPQSQDEHVRGSFRTQFLAKPTFSPMPEQSVIAGGRIFKAMGHIAHKANQNEWLNTLLCINAYNGTILWERPNSPGFMIHRNTMIATEDALYMGDNESCKVIDAHTGDIRDEIVIPKDMADGPVWKWMAMRDGVLYALLGNDEVQVGTKPSERKGLGHWPWGMWEGHDYKNPKTAFGFGRTFVAIDMETKKILWRHHEEEFMDSRSVCMNQNQLFAFSPQKYLTCIDLKDGKLLWKSFEEELLEAIGGNAPAQHYVTGYATTCYSKCNEDYVFFAGPQRKRLVSVRAKDGSVNWTQPTGNWQLVLRDDAVFAAGPQQVNGIRIAYESGSILSEFPARRACTRATGSIDSIFYRANGGTVRVLTETNTATHIAPMRPPCQDGVLISNGHLYWGPWMCGCQLSLYGNIGLTAIGGTTPTEDIYEGALLTETGIEKVQAIKIQDGDWTSFRGGNHHRDATTIDLPAQLKLKWKVDVCENDLPTAPVTAGGLTFVADRTGAIRAFDSDGRTVWTRYTGGPVYYPPAIANSRLYAGSADGCVYAYEAKTGRFLWKFRVAPEDRLIPVFGKLISSWPVAGGVVVEKNTVYAAAGIAHYDGAYVVALDPVSGKLKAQNSHSGTLSEEVNNGISLQGELFIEEGELRFLAGGVYETARYDLETLECLNKPRVQVHSQYRTAFYPYYPEYGKYLSLEHECKDGSILCHDVSYEGSLSSNLKLLAPGTPTDRKEAARWNELLQRARRRGQKVEPHIWQDESNRRFTSYVVSKDRLLATGQSAETSDKPFLTLLDLKTGNDIWTKTLPAEAVKGGTATDHQGNIYIALTNGQLMCFAPGE